MLMLMKSVVIAGDHPFPFTSSATTLLTSATTTITTTTWPSNLSSAKLFVTPRRSECGWRRRNSCCDHSSLVCCSSSIVPSPSLSFKGGRYAVQRKLGWGHFSTVWLAWDVQQSQESMAAATKGSSGACMVVLCSLSLRFRSFLPRFTNSFSRIVFPPIVSPGVSCTPKATEYAKMRKSKFKILATVKEISGSFTKVEKLRFVVVAGRFNELVTKALVTGALETFKKHAIKDDNIDVVWVPGSFEIPVVAQALAKTGKYDAVLCIGAVIRGDTTHYEAVANSAASGVLSAGLNSGIPCILGVLTCETLEQALHRAGGKSGNKGSEAAITAIEMASLFQHDIFKTSEIYDKSYIN